MKIWKIIRAVLYTAITIVLMVCSEFFVANIRYVVGGLMLIYGIPEIIIFAVKVKRFDAHTKFFWALTEVILGVVMLFLVSDYESLCVVWAIWSILRETFEVEEAVRDLIHHRPGIISIIESIVCSYFAIALILNPTEHHAMIHVFWVLPIELISTAVIYPALEILFKKVVHKNLLKEDDNAD